MTQLPPERRDPNTQRPATDWHALLNGEAQADAARRAAAAQTAQQAAVDAAGAAAEPAQPLTRRELREREQRAQEAQAAQAPSGAQARPAGSPTSDVQPSRVPEYAAAQATGRQQPAGAGPYDEPARAETPVDPFVASRVDRRANAYDDYHEPKKKRRGPWGCLIGLLIVGALVAGAAFFLQGPISAVIAHFTPAADYEGAGTGEVVFMIHDGDTGSSIAENLAAQDVVASYDAFYDLLLAQSPEPEFQPGAYRLANQMSSQAALDALTDPANKLENTFVIPEGTALPDVLVSASEGTGIPLEELQAAAAESPQSYGLPAEAKTLEGFLFPATYTLDPGIDARGVLQTLVDRQFQALDEAGVAPADRWKTVILASIVQREAGSNTDDFPKIARVFQNRLDQGINLESDATVAYGTGNMHTVWTTDEERADASNLYNTYANPGLPVGPIGNPGDVAINAALHPADGTWLFFVPVNLATGETVFSTTVDEHDAAVAQLQEWCAASDENAAYCE
ncbi:endolytic transglycosylase MltG [Agromyces allii]|uniref:Endolytic murein transglycosylase n=1 Tax=Agromyces allii TaxID=393607 RepID=A0ABP5BTE8_9MICO|nr:endolytic transglycosylase MltG [Agromyces allii]